ncbi:hypothetical protein [Streptomyces sp. NPDC055006]
MAEVSKDVERIVTEVTTYTLTLTADEALALAIVTGMVGGDDRGTPREHTNAVHQALKTAGVTWWGTDMHRQFSGHILAGE